MTRVSNQIAQSTFFFAKLERMHVDEQLSAQPLSLATELTIAQGCLIVLNKWQKS